MSLAVGKEKYNPIWQQAFWEQRGSWKGDDETQEDVEGSGLTWREAASIRLKTGFSL